MRCQNITDDNRRCKRTASKIAIVKHAIDENSQNWGYVMNVLMKMYNDQLFKDHIIQVTELNKNKHEFFYS